MNDRMAGSPAYEVEISNINVVRVTPIGTLTVQPMIKNPRYIVSMDDPENQRITLRQRPHALSTTRL
jgi:hypothetical protein